MDWDTILIWLRPATAIIVFVASCISLGYLAGFWVRRRKWPGWIAGLISLAIAFLWPIIVVVYIIIDVRRYSALHPHDDAPGMVVASVIFVGGPYLYILSLPLGLIGVWLSRRWALKGVFR